MATAGQIRQAALDLSTLATEELLSLPLPNDPYQLREVLTEVLPLIASHYGLALGALTADWYDDMRFDAGVKGRFRASPHVLPDDKRFAKLAAYSISPLFQEEPDMETTLSKVTGGLQRTVMDQQRLTIVDATQVDPQAKGWSRTGVGHNCEFCEMLISRGDVYTGKGVTFRSHDRCNCSATPSWDPNARLVTGEPYRQSERNRNKKLDNKRAYEFMRFSL